MPCLWAKKRWLTACAPPDGDLPGSDDNLAYMPWTWTPVVPAAEAADAAFAAAYLLGHHGNGCFSGLDTFTLDALRPARSLSTLRGLPRDSAARKTRYREGSARSQYETAPGLSLFPRAGLSPAGRRQLCLAHMR